ncbi:iron permease [Mycena latifolia]|nr:iron permease [Mycena latifolia]
MPQKSRAFWMSFIAIMAGLFLSAMDTTAMGTALPTIATALDDTEGDFTWIGSAYTLSSTAFIPLSGSLANAFGRQVFHQHFPALALAGAAQSMPMMIAARGIGGGGIISLSEIIAADIVPLAERGIYNGLIGLVWCFACSIGPPIGGALSNKGRNTWRWLFFLNLPLTVIAFLLISVYLSVRTPAGSVRSKLAQVDWGGNVILVIGAGLAIIGMTWGGIRYPWRSAEVLAPLLTGLFLLAVFVVYEAKVPRRPTIPFDVLTNRTSLSGQVYTMIYYVPVFFQACLGASAMRSGVDFLPGTLVTAPFVLVAGAMITVLQKYRAVNWIGWVLMITGFGLFSTLREDSAVGKWVGYQIVVAIGIGMLFVAPVFALLAPLPNDRVASALALLSFTRSFCQTWGITISSTVLQNMLKKRLPLQFVSQFPPGFEIAYAAIPAIRQLEDPLRKEVENAFARSMAVVWQVMIGISGLGLVFSLFMAEVPMGTTVDERYTLKEMLTRNCALKG